MTHETAVRSAFQNLMAVWAKTANWLLIPEQRLANGKRPDGTLHDTFNLPRGYWEAKDTKDDLLTEFRKKINAAYPISNTIFEDTRRAILYQNSKLVGSGSQPYDGPGSLLSLYRSRYRLLRTRRRGF